MQGASSSDFIQAISGGDRDVDNLIQARKNQNQPITDNVLGGAGKIIQPEMAEDIERHLGLATPVPFAVPKAKANKSRRKTSKELETISKISPVLAARQELTAILKGIKIKHFTKKASAKVRVDTELAFNKYTWANRICLRTKGQRSG